jgi:hypothetical protein
MLPSTRREQSRHQIRAIRLVVLTLALAIAALTVASLSASNVSATAATSGTISCKRASKTMVANTSGSIMLGGGPTGNLQLPFVGNCVLSGTIPAGWTVQVTPYSTLSATAGSGNAGTLEYLTDNSVFADSGTFYNSGTLVDNSTGWVQNIAVANFVNTGAVVANGPGLEFASAPTGVPAVPVATFLDQGSVKVNHGGTFSSGSAANTTFVLPIGGAIDVITGTFNIANYSTFDMDGGSVTTGILHTNQFLGAAAPTFNFAAHVPAGSTGTIDDVNGGALHGVIPKHWTVEVTGGSLTASPGSGNAGTLEYNTNNSVLLDPGTFINSGTLVDDSAGNVQNIAVTKFVNTGMVIANGPGLGFQAAPTSQPAVPAVTFLDQGSVKVDHGGIFSSGGASNTTFILPPGGTIDVITGTFNIANYSTFDMEGGSVTAGLLRTSQFLGAAPPTFIFAARVPAGSSGAIDDTNGGTLHGVIPMHWNFEVTGGSLTAWPGSGNAGVLTLDGFQFVDPSTFTNSGSVIDNQGVQVNGFVNQAHATLVVGTGSRFAASGSVTNAGQVTLALNDTMSIGGSYTQKSNGTLQVTVAGTYSYSHLVVKGRAHLGGVLRVIRGPGFKANVGDYWQIVTSAAITAPFRSVIVVGAGPGHAFKVAYSSTALTLTMGS